MKVWPWIDVEISLLKMLHGQQISDSQSTSNSGQISVEFSFSNTSKSSKNLVGEKWRACWCFNHKLILQFLKLVINRSIFDLKSKSNSLEFGIQNLEISARFWRSVTFNLISTSTIKLVVVRNKDCRDFHQIPKSLDSFPPAWFRSVHQTRNHAASDKSLT